MPETNATAARYAYLGPEGTFTEAALAAFDPDARAGSVPYPTIQATLDAVRSAPVAAGTGPGRPTTTNRVTASETSFTSPARTASPYRSAANAPASAASIIPSEACRAASALDEAGSHSASGRCPASQRRHCGCACG